MPVSRRELFTLGAGGLATAFAARGHEVWSALGVPDLAAASAIQLASNENPRGPGQRALDAIRGAFDVANRYPYEQAHALTVAVARACGVGAGNVILGCGSTEVLRMAIQAFASPLHPLVTAAPTFEMPARYASAVGAPVHAVPVDAALGIDLAAMERAAVGAGVVYVCNPNNPTATVLPATAVTSFVDRLAVSSPQTLVLVDEAYLEYVVDPAHRSAVWLAANRPNVVVARTFSKLYGMAGLRCGYGVADAGTIAKLAPFKLETNVNQLAIAAALASLEDADHVVDERGANREALAYTRHAFQELGYRVAPSQTNFVFVDLGRDARFFRDACRREGVLVGRAFPPLRSYVRISMGTMDEMRRACDTFRSVLRSANDARS